jgi:CRISPR-associated protein Csh2
MNNKSIYFIYDAVNCTPNGDPDNGEQRYNEITKKAVVSDLRIKRFGRDNLNNIGINVFYFYDREAITVGDKSISGAAARFNAFCNENKIVLNVKKPKKDKNNQVEVEVVANENGINVDEVLLKHFIDVRLFGGVLTAKKNNTHITGSLQFDAENESINEVLHGKNLVNRGLTTVFPSKDDNGQGNMGRDSYLRYGLFCVKGRFSATTAKKNEATDEDVNIMLAAIWNGMETANSRSKYGHQPIACIIVDHPTKETKNGYLGSMFEKSFSPMTIKTDKKLSDIYCREDYEFDFSPLKNVIGNKNVERVTIYCSNDAFIQKYFTNILPTCEIVNPLEILMKLV